MRDSVRTHVSGTCMCRPWALPVRLGTLPRPLPLPLPLPQPRGIQQSPDVASDDPRQPRARSRGHHESKRPGHGGSVCWAAQGQRGCVLRESGSGDPRHPNRSAVVPLGPRASGAVKSGGGHTPIPSSFAPGGGGGGHRHLPQMFFSGKRKSPRREVVRSSVGADAICVAYPEGMILDVQPLVKLLFCPTKPSPNGFLILRPLSP